MLVDSGVDIVTYELCYYLGYQMKYMFHHYNLIEAII